ncbi:hypothetical protein DASB73_013190 [Starmerella bacillaris]|uniref:Uncharacterized protein n=1 Tax=Starmerella bacillaris TaxID=1247836 RepID=A0AAV5RGR3_STABA|nr:hypothetical protein DASB73_013190 [Starmerella bacillaris]
MQAFRSTTWEAHCGAPSAYDAQQFSIFTSIGKQDPVAGSSTTFMLRGRRYFTLGKRLDGGILLRFSALAGYIFI